MFHPKIYLFERDGGRWDCIVGSANFTGAAFNVNAEAAMLISEQDDDAGRTYADLVALLDGYREQSAAIGRDYLEAYRAARERQLPRLERVQGTYSTATPVRKPPRSPLDVPMFRESWPEYAAAIQRDAGTKLQSRLDVLARAEELFREHGSFALIPQQGRAGIAGFRRDPGLDWLCFGSMKGHGKFKQAVNANNADLSKALDEIPLDGPVTREHFEAYRARFVSAFEKSGVATGTRLLAYKRPDVFLCLDSRNRVQLCEAFGIPKSVRFEQYWDRVVARILDSRWWNAAQPEDALERRLWRARAAFLDVRFYEP